MTSPPTSRIAALLIEIRGDDRSQSAAARAAKQGGVAASQGSISKWEHGQRVPKPGVAKQYAMALGATPEQRTDLVELCQAADDRTVKRQTRLVRADAQRRILAVERRSREIRTWQCEIVPGLMQTWPYMVQVLEREPGEEWAKLKRDRLALVDDPDRLIVQIVPEGVLRTVLGSAKVMAGQLDHLAEMSRRPNVRIGIVPQGRPVPPPPPSFHLFGDEEATNETLAGTAFLTDRPDLDKHRREFDRLAETAVFDDEARDILSRLAVRYREDQA